MPEEDFQDVQKVDRTTYFLIKTDGVAYDKDEEILCNNAYHVPNQSILSH